MPRIVVIGTGTGVGKTTVTCELARALRTRTPAASVLALKPIETGLGEVPSDADRLAAALGAAPIPALYGFEPPVSPHLAARQAGVAIDVARVRDWVRERESRVHDATSHVTQLWTLVETAGGVFSPLSESATNFELALALEPAQWLLVAPDALGVLHDVTATLLALEHRGRAPDYVVLSAARGRDASTGTNARELVRLGIVEPAAVFGLGAIAGLDELIKGMLG